MENGLRRDEPVRRACLGEPLPAVAVTIKGWEVRAGDLEPNPVPCLEHIGGRADQDTVLVHPVRLDWRRVLRRLAEPRADDPFSQIDSVPTRAHIDEFGG